jgi:hypothetical protein
MARGCADWSDSAYHRARACRRTSERPRGLHGRLLAKIVAKTRRAVCYYDAPHWQPPFSMGASDDKLNCSRHVIAQNNFSAREAQCFRQRTVSDLLQRRMRAAA